MRTKRIVSILESGGYDSTYLSWLEKCLDRSYIDWFKRDYYDGIVLTMMEWDRQ